MQKQVHLAEGLQKRINLQSNAYCTVMQLIQDKRRQKHSYAKFLFAVNWPIGISNNLVEMCLSGICFWEGYTAPLKAKLNISLTIKGTKLSCIIRLKIKKEKKSQNLSFCVFQINKIN